MDGAGDWQVLARIILPISLPGIAVAGLLSTIFSWNEYLRGDLHLHQRTDRPGVRCLIHVVGGAFLGAHVDGALAGHRGSRPPRLGRAAPVNSSPDVGRRERLGALRVNDIDLLMEMILW
jgi:hypothetical protein